MVAATACGGTSKAEGSGDSDDGKGSGNGAGGDDSSLTIAFSPEDGAESVATWDEFSVTADGGTLTEVTVTGPEGEEVPGEFAEDDASWTPVEHFANGTTYEVTASGEDSEGRAATETAAFTTVAAEATVDTSSMLWNWIEDGGTVGVGTVVSITFDKPVENTQAVAEAIEFETEPAVEVRPHWFGNQRVDFRPEEYWAPGTDVTVKFRTRGVEVSPGVYGTRHNDRSFTVGHSQVSTVDVKKLTMDVQRDGELLKSIPITAGSPGKDTWNGKMVVSEMFEETRMDGATVGYDYDLPDVPHAMRLSTSGTFLHGNYWSSNDTFGSRLDTHGCIGLKDVQGRGDSSTPAAWFYQNTRIGDVVEVINSDDDVIAPDNGINGWNMDWSQWGAGQ
ncbi:MULTISPECIES: Ig-like domain-containing protein [unclassified Streptomyces]|uniref:L,D-transpeptidase n=1 Tax=unclassified Streptomyces TaxID=2593676 RepID=UPI000CD58BC1|nr:MULTISPECIES: Ig-like domain-containing protein [unclassified Streptomyces]